MAGPGASAQSSSSEARALDAASAASSSTSARATKIAAAGTLGRAPHRTRPGRLRSAWLSLEIAALYVALPLALAHAILSYRVALFVLLPPLLAMFLLILLLDRDFSLRRELTSRAGAASLASIVVTAAVAGAIIGYGVSELMPTRFLEMVRERPQVWERVMLLYPFLSVLPQEIAYRTFFFHRYGPLFGANRAALVVVNAVLFGFAHLLFANWLAVAGTFAAGLLFAWRYDRTRSFWAVWFEHTLWGWLVFTIGLGGFFFSGVPNLR